MATQEGLPPTSLTRPGISAASQPRPSCLHQLLVTHAWPHNTAAPPHLDTMMTLKPCALRSRTVSVIEASDDRLRLPCSARISDEVPTLMTWAEQGGRSKRMGWCVGGAGQGALAAGVARPAAHEKLVADWGLRVRHGAAAVDSQPLLRQQLYNASAIHPLKSQALNARQHGQASWRQRDWRRDRPSRRCWLQPHSSPHSPQSDAMWG